MVHKIGDRRLEVGRLNTEDLVQHSSILGDGGANELTKGNSLFVGARAEQQLRRLCVLKPHVFDDEGGVDDEHIALPEQGFGHFGWLVEVVKYETTISIPLFVKLVIVIYCLLCVVWERWS